MDVVILTLALLATYRLATDFAWESGPGALYEIVRGSAVVRFGGDHWIAEGLACPICLSFWIGFVIAAVALWFTPSLSPFLFPLVWLGIAGGAAFLARRSTP